MEGKVILFGATGYTGRKTARELVALDLAPLLVGRNGNKLSRLAGECGGLDIHVADVSDPASLFQVVKPGDVLLTTVGPFLRFGDAALSCARSAGAHYIDSTGEPAFVRRVFEEYGGPARQAGLIFLTAFGYDYVPGNVVAAAALRAAGSGATKVEIGYFTAGGGEFRQSEGTQASLVGAVLDPGLFWRDGRLVEDFGGTRLAHFSIDGKRLPAISVPGSEHLALPHDFPQLEEVGVYLGWFGKLSYPMHQASRMSARLMGIPGVRSIFKRLTPEQKSDGKGPGPEELASSGSHIAATAYDRKGQRLASARLTGIDGYTYTAKMLAWGASAILNGRAIRRGALGPVEAFGLDIMIEANRQCGLELTAGT